MKIQWRYKVAQSYWSSKAESSNNAPYNAAQNAYKIGFYGGEKLGDKDIYFNGNKFKLEW